MLFSQVMTFQLLFRKPFVLEDAAVHAHSLPEPWLAPGRFTTQTGFYFFYKIWLPVFILELKTSICERTLLPSGTAWTVFPKSGWTRRPMRKRFSKMPSTLSKIENGHKFCLNVILEIEIHFYSIFSHVLPNIPYVIAKIKKPAITSRPFKLCFHMCIYGARYYRFCCSKVI